MSEKLTRIINELHEHVVFMKKRIEELNAEDFFASEEKGSEVPVKKESTTKITVKEQTESKLVIEHEGRTYSRFKPCKYKCGMWSSFANDYKKGDRPIHINPVTREVLGGCPKYE